jgi:hypothetical protein
VYLTGSGASLAFLVIRYRAASPGRLDWTFGGTWDQLLAGGPDVQTHDFTPGDVSVRVTSQTVPEGSTLGLFAFGLPWLHRVVAKRRAGISG